MHRREFLLGAMGAGALGVVLAASDSACAAPAAGDSLREFLRFQLGPGAKLAGRVAVVVQAGRARTVGFGSSGAHGVAMNRGTVFEIGSITKVLTALLLADMAARGEVAFGDPVAQYLPPWVRLHERGRAITLLDLAAYQSGLPNNPGSNIQAWLGTGKPFADYTTGKLYAFLADCVPAYEPGTHYEYANLGYALLGIALARRAGKSYEELLRQRICRPLHLKHTRVALTAGMRRHLAQGHDPEHLKPAPLWDLPELAGMGGVRSTAADLTVILKSAMGFRRTPLHAAWDRLLENRRPTGAAGTDAAFGWFISSSQGEEIVWKSGLTGGYSSFMGFSMRSGRGAILLSNGGYTEAGFRLINPDFDPGDLQAVLR